MPDRFDDILDRLLGIEATLENLAAENTMLKEILRKLYEHNLEQVKDGNGSTHGSSTKRYTTNEDGYIRDQGYGERLKGRVCFQREL